MAEALSVAGIALGIASLTIQMVDGCIKGYTLLLEAKGMEADCRYVRESLRIQAHRLLAWCQVAGLLEEENQQGQKIGVILGASQVQLVAALSEIRTLMEDFAQLNGRYVDDLKPDEDEMTAKATEAVDFVKELKTVSIKYEAEKVEKRYIRGMNALIKGAKDLKDVARHPKRLRWAALDAPAFKKLVFRLTELNDYLYSLLDARQAKEVQETVRNTYLAVVQIQKTVESLELLFEGAMLFLSQRSPAPHGYFLTQPRQNESMLAALAQFKSLNQRVLNGTSLRQTREASRLDFAQIEYSRSNPVTIFADHRRALSRTQGTCLIDGVKLPVWIEWKPYILENIVPKDFKNMYLHPDAVIAKIQPETVQRAQELATLLMSEKPRQFCTAHCVRYFDDRDDPKYGEENPTRFGFVYEKPAYADPARPPRSLYELMNEDDKPPLTNRIALAYRLSSCLLYLHAANWLHKSLRSDNVLFFSRHGNSDLTEPYLSGFEYARPAAHAAVTTTAPEVILEWEIYRHPDYQGERPQHKARKTYDIYSLGVILLEIAHWRPLDQVMGLRDLDKESVDFFKSIKNRLVDTEPQWLHGVTAQAGPVYERVARKCLEGAHGFDIQFDDDETSKETGSKLQGLYTEGVVNVLRDVVSERFTAETLDRGERFGLTNVHVVMA